LSSTSADLPQDLGSSNGIAKSFAHRRPRTNFRRIIYSTLSIETIQRVVARHYHLDGPIECTLFWRGVSDTYLVSTATGNYALKVYRSRWRTRQAILAELAAIEHMNSRGVDVAIPIPRHDGRLTTGIAAPEGVRIAVLFRWAPGRAPSYIDPVHARRYGNLVARLHIAGDSLTASASRPRMDFEYLLGRPLERIRSRTKSMSIVPRLEPLANRVLARFDAAKSSLPDWGFCHGDIWSDNALLDDQRLVVFDFDFCGTGWRAFDIASFKWHARFQGVEQVAWQPFIEGYLDVRPAGAGSLEFMPLFMIIRHLWTAAHVIDRTAETGINSHPENFFDNLVVFCERIEADTVAALG
jgi:Ser/Thr protein kinase RdoA (MazF antagonist)